MLPGNMNDGIPSPLADIPSTGITIPPLSGPIGHVRQKPSRVGLPDRHNPYDVTTGHSVRAVPRSNPSPPPVHHRQFSEGGGVDKPTLLNGGRNASISSLDTSQATLTSTNGMDPPTQALSGGRRRHGDGHSHKHSHHHHTSHAGSVPAKPASMMSAIPIHNTADG